MSEIYEKELETFLEESNIQYKTKVMLDSSVYVSDLNTPHTYRIIFDPVKETPLFLHKPTKDARFKEERKPYLTPDYTVKIPAELTNEIGWQIGDELVIDVYDEDNAEIIISKKFKGEEAKEKFRALRNNLYAKNK